MSKAATPLCSQKTTMLRSHTKTYQQKSQSLIQCPPGGEHRRKCTGPISRTAAYTRSQPVSPDARAEFEGVLQAATETVSKAVRSPAVAPERRVGTKSIQKTCSKSRSYTGRTGGEHDSPSKMCPIPIPLEAHFASVWTTKEVDKSIYRHKWRATNEVC